MMVHAYWVTIGTQNNTCTGKFFKCPLYKKYKGAFCLCTEASSCCVKSNKFKPRSPGSGLVTTKIKSCTWKKNEEMEPL